MRVLGAMPRPFARGPFELLARERAVLRVDDGERRGPELCGRAVERGELALAREIDPVRHQHVRGLDLLAQQRERSAARELARIDDHHHGRELERVAVRAAADRVDQVLRAARGRSAR
jgi:hypothetical protein